MIRLMWRWVVVLIRGVTIAFSFMPEKRRLAVCRMTVAVLVAVLFFSVVRLGAIRPSPIDPTRAEMLRAMEELAEAARRVNQAADNAIYDIECVTMRFRCNAFPDDPGCAEFLLTAECREWRIQ